MKRIIKAALFLAMIFSVISYNSVAFSQEEEEQPMRTFNKTSLITNISKLNIMNNDKYQQWADLQ
ncbi:MAG: hypothetical protein KAR13_12925, partial [Desulfobulbaceae bacterium]|nr:hypothetical protein [Desulfobulbaceae bacterium]